MAEYIDKALLKELLERYGCDKDLLEIVDCIPADADVMQVVRCKDCVHGFFRNSSGGMYCCTSPAGLSLETKNSFCCYGERKEDKDG